MKKFLALLIGIFILSSVAGCKSKEATVNAQELANIQSTGLNSKGHITVTVDFDKIDAVFNTYYANNKDQQEGYNFLKALESITYKVESGRDNLLSNGDEIGITAIYDDFIMSNANITIENPEFTYIVSGLDEPTIIDVFEEIELVYNGASPYSRVEVHNRAEKQYIRDIKYNAEPRDNLRIGDKIVVTAQFGAAVAAAAEKEGFLISETLTKEFIVENIDEYVKDFDAIDQATKDRILKECTDRMESDCANLNGRMAKSQALDIWNVWGDKFNNTKIEAPELTNIYFLSLKEGATGNAVNKIFYVYKVTAHYAQDPEPLVAYGAIRVANIINKVDGSFVFEMENFALSSVVAANKDFDLVYREIVTAQKDSYEVKEIMS